ncbi:hypothetical protein SUGI_0632880 [Cryptomeria japonica]|nr:hypothetical protein SUGI_0632880 [Cryptomeria japonica]
MGWNTIKNCIQNWEAQKALVVAVMDDATSVDGHSRSMQVWRSHDGKAISPCGKAQRAVGWFVVLVFSANS